MRGSRHAACEILQIVFLDRTVDFRPMAATYEQRMPMILTATAPNSHQDWIAASQVQARFMMHSQAIPVLDYHGECRQLGAVGGDFYMFLPISSDRLAFAIGDASGKGLPAALMSASVQASLRTALMLAGDDPALMMSAINRHLYDVSLPERYATLFYGVIERSTLRLQYVNAGHNAPLVMRADGSAVWLREGGAPVGLFATDDYDLGLVDLRPDDVLLAYTEESPNQSIGQMKDLARKH